MILNATLLRLDDPAPAAPGAALGIRCCLGNPSLAEQQLLGGMGTAGQGAAAVLYLPMQSMPSVGGPEVGQTATVQVDGCPPEAFRIVHAADRVGAAGNLLGHVQLFLVGG